VSGGQTYLEVDASAQNRRDALLDILLILFVLLTLLIFVVTVNITIYRVRAAILTAA
jgi:hypothetical protein